MVRALNWLGGSVDFVTKVKDAYKGELGFAGHSASRHSVASPLPDQLKGAWYCVHKGLFSNSGSEANII